MAIEILHRGNAPSEFFWEGTCNTCSTKIECKASDGDRKSSRDQRDPDWIEVKCPVCPGRINAYQTRRTLPKRETFTNGDYR